MKLAEALMIRGQYKSDIENLRKRAIEAAKIRDGETIIEDANDMISSAEKINTKLENLIIKINRTNEATVMDDGARLSDALVKRDFFIKKNHIIKSVIESARERSRGWYDSEKTSRITVDVAMLERRSEYIVREYRELDARIQALNWATDLIE
jgi:hypothetical protein